MYVFVVKLEVYFWQEFPPFLILKIIEKLKKQTPFKTTCTIFKNKPILIPFCSIKWAAKTVVQKRHFYMHITVYSSKEELPFQVFQQKVIASCSIWSQRWPVAIDPIIQVQICMAQRAMPCNSNNVLIKENSNWIIHRRKKHLKIFILLQSYWQMCVGDAAEILAHSDE